MDKITPEVVGAGKGDAQSEANAALLGGLLEIGKRYMDLIETKMKLQDAPIQKTAMHWIFGLILVITIITAGLVFLGKLDAASFTFVVGTALGYLLSFSKLFMSKKDD